MILKKPTLSQMLTSYDIGARGWEAATAAGSNGHFNNDGVERTGHIITPERDMQRA
jgi:hypothetical protein